MTQFVLVYFGGGMPESEAEQAKVLQTWMDWYTDLGSAVVDTGNPFTPVAKSIACDGAVSDGALGPMSTGYTILEADSLDQAVQMAQGCPMLKGGGEVTVLETFPAM